MNTIEQTVRTGNGFKERLHIKSFNSSQAMYTFLNKGSNACNWSESNRSLARGVYAYAGGAWHNVKTLDASVLAHI